jgi:single-strand DNA-binding protein
MASLNQVQLIGNLGRDPETRYLPNGEAVTNVAIATTETWKDKNTGEKKEQTEWHRVTLYRRLAEVAGQYLSKGSQIYIQGRLQTRKWTDKDGVERYTTEIIADTMKMLGGRPDGAQDSGQRQQQPRQQANGDNYRNAKEGRIAPQQRPRSDFSDMDDEIPF